MIDYVIIGLIVVLMGMFVYLFVMMNKKSDVQSPISIEKDIQGYFNEKLAKEFGEFKANMATLVASSNQQSQKDLNEFKDYMMAKIDKQLKEINDKVEQRLGQGFEKNNRDFYECYRKIS